MKIRFTVQTFVNSRMACYTAYDGVSLPMAETAHRVAYLTLQIGRGTADVHWRENDLLVYKVSVVNGETIKSNGFDRRMGKRA